MFANTKALAIPQGDVVKIEVQNQIFWTKETEPQLKGNLVPYAIDENGDILNGVGYVDNSRISSSGAIKSQTGTPLTGFIDCEGINDSSVIRTKNLQFVESLYCGVVFYDKDFNLLQGMRFPQSASLASGLASIMYSTTETGTKSTELSNGVTEIVFNFKEDVISTYKPKYFRLFAQGNGADMIVTIDEEIS